jgi:uncharacterized membrane protein YecN with MAPEG domain
MTIIEKIAVTFCCFAMGAVAVIGSLVYWVGMPQEEPPIPPDSSIASDHCNRLVAQMVGVIQSNPDTDHVLIAIASSGSTEVITAIPAYSEWTEFMPETITALVQDALDRGVLAFQLIILDPNPGSIATK